jgi:hypothetical protein
LPDGSKVKSKSEKGRADLIGGYSGHLKGTKKAALLRPLKRGVGRDRTADTRIFSPLLYRLSYRTILYPTPRRRPGLKFGAGRNFDRVAKIGFPGKIPK